MEKANALRGRSHRVRGAVALLFAIVVAVVFVPRPARADIAEGEMVNYSLAFPVDGPHYFADTFGAPRSGGRSHQGQDIMAVKGTPIVAAASGVVRYVNWTAGSHLNPDRCCSLVIGHDDGWETRYLHLNNDTTGTDDGRAWGIVDGIVPGARVGAGQIIGWVGDSGNAENTPSHLHFELLDRNGAYVNSFESLLRAGGNPPSKAWSAEDDPLFAVSGVLRSGDTGREVARLQEILSSFGYSVGPVDGIFGRLTRAAVRSFQGDLGVTIDGLVGPDTRSAAADSLADIAGVLGLGSRGSEVLEIQELLTALGFSPGFADGVFGPKTLAAVIAFQRSLGLQVDGLVGPQTGSRLGIR